MSETRGNRTKKSSGWMWAFFIILALNVAVAVWLVINLQGTPSDTDEARIGEPVHVETPITFEVLTNRSQMNQVVNLYLEEEMEEEDTDFRFELTDQAELHGVLQVLGFDVDFTLLTDPYVMEDGNLQLRAQSIQLGAFELPISMAMNVISQQIDLPEWVRVDSEQQFILVALNEFQLDNGTTFEMQHIDLEEDDIRIGIILPEEAIK
ncbi:MAG: YpmS family protein [Alkalibacterium sp.]|nr:YpmS family protein [Alkalibacterium sp.]